jgi:predicted RNA binding protein YcfA (HicA-like mRNA interferase family)
METSRAKIVRRLEREGWINRGGGNHDVFTHPARPGVIIVVPRHRTLSPGVARQIAKLAGWL